MPITWQGWLSLFLFAIVMLVIVRELHGAIRVVAFLLAAGAYAVFCRSRTVSDRS